MTPWRSTKYAVVNKNYREYEFSSPLNVWKPQPQYTGIHKMKFLDFTVHPGHVLFIPPFWHYSMQFLKEESEENHLVHVFNYGSVMNVLSNVFNLGHHYYEKNVSKKKETEVASSEI